MDGPQYTDAECYLLRLYERLHAGQCDVLERFRESDARVFVLCCSRRYGKSTLACALAIGTCIAQPGASVRYAAPTAKMVRSIIEPIMRDLLEDCPAGTKPSYSRQEGVYRFPNGSELHVVGCDNGGHERLRGVSTDLGIVDEAGFVDELTYVVKSILLPQTMTVDGRLFIPSTPPRSPAHPFATLAEESESKGAYEHRTIYDAPHITDAMRDEYMAESGGEDSTDWQREYLARFITDDASAVIPEFSRHEDHVAEAVERPTHFDTYVSMDVGFHDLTVAALGYYDFANARVVVEDEIVCNRMTSVAIDVAVAAKEAELWGERPVYMRVVDAPPIVIAELNRDNARPWFPTRKDDKEAQVNALRRTVAEHRIVIHPRCKTIRAHMRHAVWNTNRTQFARVEGQLGHFDGVDACVYLVRNVNRAKNPYPALSSGVTSATHHIRPGVRGMSDDERQLRSAFGRRRRG